MHHSAELSSARHDFAKKTSMKSLIQNQRGNLNYILERIDSTALRYNLEHYYCVSGKGNVCLQAYSWLIRVALYLISVA